MNNKHDFIICNTCQSRLRLTLEQSVFFQRSLKTVKIAMRELINEGFEVFILKHHVFDLIASSEKQIKLIKTIYTDSNNFNIEAQKNRLSRFYKYPQFYDDNMTIKNKCFTKELWVRNDIEWVSKISVN